MQPGCRVIGAAPGRELGRQPDVGLVGEVLRVFWVAGDGGEPPDEPGVMGLVGPGHVSIVRFEHLIAPVGAGVMPAWERPSI